VKKTGIWISCLLCLFGSLFSRSWPFCTCPFSPVASCSELKFVFPWNYDFEMLTPNVKAWGEAIKLWGQSLVNGITVTTRELASPLSTMSG
jgi:hypothetical protein